MTVDFPQVMHMQGRRNYTAVVPDFRAIAGLFTGWSDRKTVCHVRCPQSYTQACLLESAFGWILALRRMRGGSDALVQGR